jgi:DNA-binding NarL/FixJ family response regulator
MTDFFRSSSSHLAKRSDVANACKKHGLQGAVVIVSESEAGAERLTANLRILFGYRAAVRWARRTDDAIDTLNDHPPALVILCEAPPESADAFSSMGALRSAGYCGPIVVVTRDASRNRRQKLKAAGAADVIHSDDADSSRVGEAVEIARLSTVALEPRTD